jgi:acyl-CoA dehydrogenase
MRPKNWQKRMQTEGMQPVCREWQATKYDAGWACLGWPEEYGGRALSSNKSAIFSEEESKLAPPSAAMLVVGVGMTGPMLMVHANDDQKERFLKKTARADIVWCQLFSEPAGGSDLAALRTRAVKDGDEWVVNGSKIWSSGAHEADWGILVTRTDPDVPKHKGLTFFLLDMNTPGVEAKPIKQVSGQAHFNEVFFDNVRIPDANRLGAVGDGWKVSLTTLMNERMAVGSSAQLAVGFETLFDLARDLEGEDGPLIKDGAVRAQLAEWYARSSGIKYANARTMSALSRGDTPGPEASIGKLVNGPMRQSMSEYGMNLIDMAGGLMEGDEAP